MRTHGNLDKDQELNDAAWEASRGAVVGAAKVSRRAVSAYLCKTDMATVGIVLGGSWTRGIPIQSCLVSADIPITKASLLTRLIVVVSRSSSKCSPLSPPTAYCLLTICSFLQMSGMAGGSMIEADKRLRLHEVQMRRHKRTVRDAEVWRRYEEDFNISKAAASSPSSDNGKSDGD